MRGQLWSGNAVHQSSGFYWETPAEDRQSCGYVTAEVHYKCLVFECFLTVFPVKVTGGDCQEMLKLELLVGVKLVEAEPAELLLLDGIDTGAVA